MTPEQLISLKEELTKTVRATVNGKIDCIGEKLDEHITFHNEERRETHEYRKRIEPALRAYEDTQATGRIGAKIGGIILFVGGVWLIARQIFGF